MLIIGKEHAAGGLGIPTRMIFSSREASSKIFEAPASSYIICSGLGRDQENITL